MEIINSVLNFITEYGLQGLIYLVLALVFVLVFRVVWYMIPYWTRNITVKKEQQKLKERTKADKIIREKISQLLINTKADRGMVVEFHNGKENMTGLPFRYGTFTYELDVDSIPRIGQKYDELNLSRYTAPMHLIENKFFIGTTEEFKKIDREMGRYLQEDDTKYSAMMLLKHDGINIGILMITYTTEPAISEHKILGYITQSAQEISSLLTLNKKIQ